MDMDRSCFCGTDARTGDFPFRWHDILDIYVSYVSYQFNSMLVMVTQELWILLSLKKAQILGYCVDKCVTPITIVTVFE